MAEISQEDYERLVDWYRTGRLDEDDEGTPESPRLAHDVWKGPEPRTLQELFDAWSRMTAKIKNGEDVTLAVIKDSVPVQFMSGEIQNGKFWYTFKSGQAMPVPVRYVVDETTKEVTDAGFKTEQLEYNLAVDDETQKITEMALDTMRFPGMPDLYYFLALEVETDEKRDKANPLETSVKNRPETAKNFVDCVSELKSKTGRDIYKMQVLLVNDGEQYFSVRPAMSKGRSMVFWLSKLDKEIPMDDPEITTYGELCDWISGQNNPDALLFFKSRGDVYEINDMRFDAGQPPMIEIRQWGELTESGVVTVNEMKKMSPQRRQIMEWKRYCDSDMLYW